MASKPVKPLTACRSVVRAACVRVTCTVLHQAAAANRVVYTVYCTAYTVLYSLQLHVWYRSKQAMVPVGH